MDTSLVGVLLYMVLMTIAQLSLRKYLIKFWEDQVLIQSFSLGTGIWYWIRIKTQNFIVI